MANVNNREKKINNILTTIIVVLIIIIILLLFKGCSKNNKNHFHEGKVNIIEIKCDTNCNCECKECNNNNTKDNSKNAPDKTKKVIKNISTDTNTEVIKEVEDELDTEVDIKVLDEKETWKDKESINLFKDSSYVVNGKIAPESSGTYEFIIKNSTTLNVAYDIEFDETNNYDINMKYKLKKNNEYVIGEWVYYSQLKQANIRLNSKSKDTYYLEWKWFNSSNDNSIGENINSKYGLSINIRAVQTND